MQDKPSEFCINLFQNLFTHRVFFFLCNCVFQLLRQSVNDIHGNLDFILGVVHVVHIHQNFALLDIYVVVFLGRDSGVLRENDAVHALFLAVADEFVHFFCRDVVRVVLVLKNDAIPVLSFHDDVAGVIHLGSVHDFRGGKHLDNHLVQQVFGEFTLQTAVVFVLVQEILQIGQHLLLGFLLPINIFVDSLVVHGENLEDRCMNRLHHPVVFGVKIREEYVQLFFATYFFKNDFDFVVVEPLDIVVQFIDNLVVPLRHDLV